MLNTIGVHNKSNEMDNKKIAKEELKIWININQVYYTRADYNENSWIVKIVAKQYVQFILLSTF